MVPVRREYQESLVDLNVMLQIINLESSCTMIIQFSYHLAPFPSIDSRQFAARMSRGLDEELSEWHLGKNIKDEEIRFIAQTQVKRAHEDKGTNFRVRGRDVDPEKISRTAKRKKITEEELLAMPTARKFLLCLYLQV